MRFVTTSLLTAGLLATASIANADVISFNIGDNTATTFSEVANPNGVESAGNWNQAAGSSLSNLVDDSGNATTLDLAIGNYTNSAGPLATTSGTLYRLSDSAFAADDTLTISEIPYAEYKIIVYVAATSSTEKYRISDGTTTYFYTNDRTDTSFREITSTTEGTAAEGSYVVFGSDVSPLTGASQSITYGRVGLGGALVSGFQVVQVPEPGSLALMGIGGLLIARRRRG